MGAPCGQGHTSSSGDLHRARVDGVELSEPTHRQQDRRQRAGFNRARDASPDEPGIAALRDDGDVVGVAVADNLGCLRCRCRPNNGKTFSGVAACPICLVPGT